MLGGVPGKVLADRMGCLKGGVAANVVVPARSMSVSRPAPRRAVRPRTAAEKEFCALGPVAEAFITGAAAAGNTGWARSWPS